MKKKNKWLQWGQIGVLVFMSFILLTGCKKDTTVVYEMKENLTDIEITLVAKADKIKTHTTKSTMKYKDLGVSSKEEAKEILEMYSDEYKNVDGVTFEIDYKEDMAIQTIVMDFEKIDFDQLGDLSGLVDENTENAKKDGVSLEKTAKLLEKQGFKKKK